MTGSVLGQAASVWCKWNEKSKQQKVTVGAGLAASSVTFRKSFNLSELQFHHVFIRHLY